jgi:CBS domain-containing protein
MSKAPRRALQIASEVMTPEPICADPADSSRSLARLLAEYDISGVPVVDANGRAIGVVTRADLVRRIFDGTGNRPPAFLFEMLGETGIEPGEFDDGDLPTVGDLMTPEPACVRTDTPVTEIARIMGERRIHRVLVTDRAGIPVGIVTSLDLLEVFPAEIAAAAAR